MIDPVEDSAPVKGGMVIGDDISDPFLISAIPFTDSGSTNGFLNDYYEICPYPGDGARDVVYAFTPATNVGVSIDLCGSTFDTKVFVYESAATPGSPYACNDDYCGAGYLQSFIPYIPLTGGTTYYIVVDGYGTAAGQYILTVSPASDCEWGDCTVLAVPEGEPCSTGDDITNGGCSVVGGQFSNIEPGMPVCGSIWADALDRDTDWYRYTLPADAVVRWTVSGDFPISIYVFDLTGGCAGAGGIRLDGDPCDELEVTVQVGEAGDYGFVVTTREQFGGYTCAEGPWEYEALFEVLCACECHANPHEPADSPGTCDGVIDVLDVTRTINIAFRGSESLPDPNPACPYWRADLDCSGSIDVLDVTRMINVAFRNAERSEYFCIPCQLPE